MLSSFLHSYFICYFSSYSCKFFTKDDDSTFHVLNDACNLHHALASFVPYFTWHAHTHLCSPSSSVTSFIYSIFPMLNPHCTFHLFLQIYSSFHSLITASSSHSTFLFKLFQRYHITVYTYEFHCNLTYLSGTPRCSRRPWSFWY